MNGSQRFPSRTRNGSTERYPVPSLKGPVPELLPDLIRVGDTVPVIGGTREEAAYA
jgi:hypothetical protein